MATNNVLHQLDHNMPESGENILATKKLAPTEVAVSGATRATSSNSLPADVVVLDAANESVIIGFELPDDFDRDPATARLRVGLTVGIISGTSPTVDINLDTLTGIYSGQSSLAAMVTAITPPSTTATQLDTIGELQTIEFDLDATIRTQLEGTKVIEVIEIEIDAQAVGGTSPVAHVFGAFVRYGSMIVPALVSRRE